MKTKLLLIPTLFLGLAAQATSLSPIKCDNSTVIVDDGVVQGPFKDNRSEIRIALFKALKSEKLEGRYLRALEDATALVESIDGETPKEMIARFEAKYNKALTNYNHYLDFDFLVNDLTDMFKIEKLRCFHPQKPLVTTSYLYNITTKIGAHGFVVNTLTKEPSSADEILHLNKIE